MKRVVELGHTIFLYNAKPLEKTDSVPLLWPSNQRLPTQPGYFATN